MMGYNVKSVREDFKKSRNGEKTRKDTYDL